jgi:DNA-binding response OmpR family regulator
MTIPYFEAYLKVMLTNWGFKRSGCLRREGGWQILQVEDGPRLAILDWSMPFMEGIEVCRLARATFGRQVYIMILTAKTESKDLVTARNAAADDYITKPLKSQELRFRLASACRILDLEEQLALSLGPVPRRHGPGMSSPHASPPPAIGHYRVGPEREDLLCAGEAYSSAAHPVLVSPGMLREVN